MGSYHAHKADMKSHDEIPKGPWQKVTCLPLEFLWWQTSLSTLVLISKQQLPPSSKTSRSRHGWPAQIELPSQTWHGKSGCPAKSDTGSHAAGERPQCYLWVRDRGSHASALLKTQGQAPLTLLQHFHAGCGRAMINAAAVNQTGDKRNKRYSHQPKGISLAALP